MQYRRLVYVVVLFALFGSLSLHAAEGDVLDKIGVKIQQYPVIRADFTQTKQMPALKRPLVTTGQLTFSRNDGVLWQIFQPYRMSYILGEDKIIEIDANGIRKEKGMRDVPGLAQIGRVFRAMLGADTSALRSYFDISTHVGTQGETDKWQLLLKPRQSPLSKALSAIELSGSQFVESIISHETSGDTTTLRFNHTQGVPALSDVESQLFGKSTTSIPAISKQSAP